MLTLKTTEEILISAGKKYGVEFASNLAQTYVFALEHAAQECDAEARSQRVKGGLFYVAADACATRIREQKARLEKAYPKTLLAVALGAEEKLSR